jgi:hypothetical protein
MKKLRSRRKTRRSKQRGGPKGWLVPAITGRAVIPFKMLSHLYYRLQTTRAEAALTYSDQVFRAASIFDPDEPGVGSTALGYDIYNAMYKHYHVRAVDVDIKTVVAAGQPPVCCQLVVYNNGTNAPESGSDVQLEQWAGCDTKFASEYQMAHNHIYADLNKMFGYNSGGYSLYWTLLGANPAAAYCPFIHFRMTGAAADINTEFLALIDYTVEFAAPVAIDY